MSVTILNKSDYKISKWSGGETAQLLIYPKESTLEERNFIFRVSSATCPDEESKFSDFTGFNRYITPLDNDLELSHNGEEVILTPYKILLFDGSDDVSSKSAVRDFNLILKKGITGSMRSESISKDTRFKIFGGINLIFNYDATLEATVGDNTFRLDPFSAILVEENEVELTLKMLDKDYTNIIIVEVEVE